MRLLLRRKDNIFQRFHIKHPENYDKVPIPTDLKEKFPQNDFVYEKKEKEEYIGRAADSGNDIWYNKKRGYIERDSNKKEIKASSTLEIDETISLSTDTGHDLPFYAEVTSRTIVSGRNKSGVEKLENGIQTRLDNYFHSKKGFDQIKSEALKIGVEYRLGASAATYPRTTVELEKTKPRTRSYGREEINL